MSKFEQKHGDIVELLPTCRSYKQFSISGRIIEAWEKNENDEWVDVTLREQEIERAKLEIKKALKEIEKMEEEANGVQN